MLLEILPSTYCLLCVLKYHCVFSCYVQNKNRVNLRTYVKVTAKL